VDKAQSQSKMAPIFLGGSFRLHVATPAVILLLILPAFASGTGQDLPWARITAAPSLDRRDYDIANSRLYGYTSVGMDGTSTRWSAKMCGDLAPTMRIETFQNTVFGLCWAVSTVNFLGLFATTASVDYITACSGRIAIGTSTTGTVPPWGIVYLTPYIPTYPRPAQRWLRHASKTRLETLTSMQPLYRQLPLRPAPPAHRGHREEVAMGYRPVRL